MKFNIKEIAAKDRVFDRHLDRDTVTRMLAAAGVDLEDGPASLDVDLTLSAVDDAVLVRGSLRGEFSVTCGRCLGLCPVALDEPELAVTFLPPPDAEDPELELSLEDLDQAVHDGEQLDLEPLLREHMVLAIPIKPVCHDQCKGICAGCGASLNEEACTCDKQPAEESPWSSALQAIRDEAKRD